MNEENMNNKNLKIRVLAKKSQAQIGTNFSIHALTLLYHNLAPLGIGMPLLRTKHQVNWAKNLTNLYDKEKSDLQNLSDYRKKRTFGEKVAIPGSGRLVNPGALITSTYYDIRKKSYSSRIYGKLWSQLFPLTRKQFINLATLVGCRVPTFVRNFKFNADDRLNNAAHFLTIKYKQNGVSSFHQIIFDPMADINHGTYVLSDAKTKGLLSELNPDLSSNQLRELFEQLTIKLSLFQPFKEHGSDQNLIAFKNGIFDRKSRQLRPLTASDNITAKLSTSFETRWLKHLPDKTMLKHFGFKHLAIMLANDYHKSDSHWFEIEYPFAKITGINEAIRKFNPWNYLYRLSNYDSNRTITLFQILLSVLQTTFAHDKIMLLNGQGKRGKSTFLDIVQNIVGSPSVGPVSLSELGGKNTFAAAGMLNKVACVNNETTDDGYLRNDAKVKQVATHELMQINAKYKDPITTNFKYMAYVGATNNGLRIHGDSEADNRRLLMVNFQSHNIAKNGTADFRKVIIDSKPVTHYFADLVATCVPNFSKFTRSRTDIRVQNDQMQATNSVLHFTKEELLPALQGNNRLSSFRIDNGSQRPKGCLVRIPKGLLYDWYCNFEKGSGNQSFGSTKFFKDFTLIINDQVNRNFIKPSQRTIRYSDFIGYKRLTEDDKYLPTTHGVGRHDDFHADIGHVKRCFVINPRIPGIIGTHDDRKLTEKFKDVTFSTLKTHKSSFLKIDSVIQGVAVAHGTVITDNHVYQVKNGWFRLSKLLVIKSNSAKAKKGESEIAEKAHIKKFKAKVWKTVFPNIIRFASYDESPIDVKNEIRTISKGLNDIYKLDDIKPQIEDIVLSLNSVDDQVALENIAGLRGHSTLDDYDIPRIPVKKAK